MENTFVNMVLFHFIFANITIPYKIQSAKSKIINYFLSKKKKIINYPILSEVSFHDFDL